MSAVGRLLRLLRDRWVWWVVPIVILVLLTVLLARLGGGTRVGPFDYALERGGSSTSGSAERSP